MFNYSENGNQLKSRNVVVNFRVFYNQLQTIYMAAISSFLGLVEYFSNTRVEYVS